MQSGQKVRHYENDQKIVLKPTNKIMLIRQIKVWIKHYNYAWPAN